MNEDNPAPNPQEKSAYLMGIRFMLSAVKRATSVLSILGMVDIIYLFGGKT